jgi:hypothetical protein
MLVQYGSLVITDRQGIGDQDIGKDRGKRQEKPIYWMRN